MVARHLAKGFALLLAAAGSVAAAESNLVGAGGRVEDYDDSVDYFPHKARPQFAELFEVEYSNSHKVVTVSDSFGSTNKYVLYQRGTPQPVLEDETVTAYIQVPIAAAAVASTPYLSFISRLGERESIVALATDVSYVSDPCVLELASEGRVAEASSYNEECFGDVVDNDALAEKGVEVTFGNSATTGFDPCPSDPILNAVVVTDIYEGGENISLKSADWLKFFSLFYNREEEANAEMENIVSRVDCTSNNALACSGVVAPVPKVAWAPGYWDVTGWFMPEEGTYYQEMIQNAGGNMLVCETGSISSSFGYFYMTDDEAVACYSEAEVCIFAQPFDDLPEDVLNQLPCVVNGKYFDITKEGINYWFEQRPLSPDVLLQDTVHVLFGEEAASQFGVELHTRVFLRDPSVETGGDYANAQCADTSAVLATRSNVCENVVALCADDGGNAGSRTMAPSFLVSLLVAVLSLVVTSYLL